MLTFLTLSAFVIALAGVVFMLRGVVIPDPILTLVASTAILVSYFTLKKVTDTRSNKLDRLMALTMTLFGIMATASFIYDHWQWESLVTDSFMLKLSLIIFGMIGIYMNLVYMRAETAYRKKRGNQRIKEKPAEGYTEYKKEFKKSRLKKNEDIVTVLGNSMEHEDVPIIWKGKDFYTHMLVVGATRSGKTASILEPMIYQLLLQKKQGKKLGLSVIEPKGAFARKVKAFCDEMDIPYIYIDPERIDESNCFNPMEGEINDVAEATVVVLKGLFGKQDAFFATVQELSARNVTKLLKELHGNDMDIIDVMNTLRDTSVLKKKVEDLKARDGVTDLVHFFEAELLGSMADKYRQFVIGLRAQLENITSNDMLRQIMTGRSDIDIDEHFAEGGVLIVNTSLGKLKSAGDAFGQFIIMHLQNGTFRREGTEKSRVPHFMVVDEYSRYINPDVEIFLSLAAEYKVAGILATQSLGQLEIESGKIGAKAMKKTIMTNCRNKLCFGGVSSDDAQEFADEFGKDKIIVRQSTYKHRLWMPVLFPESYRDTESEEYRFDPTDIMDSLPKYNYIHKMMYDGQMQKPSLAMGDIVPENWQERREWEDKRVTTKLKKSGATLIKQTKCILNKKIYNAQQDKPSELTKDVLNTTSSQQKHSKSKQAIEHDSFSPREPHDESQPKRIGKTSTNQINQTKEEHVKTEEVPVTTSGKSHDNFW
ncbi:type IV secretory system conjugative DNA transfer family protein [Oceanobacillus damuensis]|uniref:type IV secretory system conjugative DNA transfer family protein n=1 Tax=Oceanobacillus damuensis TaxID=937928 RepID=UPI000AD27640|nr:type IV secretory system conjugative DNA transfer family protein [Oceanobacillus damuensis]